MFRRNTQGGVGVVVASGVSYVRYAVEIWNSPESVYKLTLSQHLPLPTVGLGAQSQGRRDIMTNHQACRNVEANEESSAFNGRSPARLGTQRGAGVLERGSATTKVSGCANAICEPSDSRIPTSPTPSALGSRVALPSPVITTYSGPAGEARADWRPLHQDSSEPTPPTDDQTVLPTTSQ